MNKAAIGCDLLGPSNGTFGSGNHCMSSGALLKAAVSKHSSKLQIPVKRATLKEKTTRSKENCLFLNLSSFKMS